MSTTLEYLDAVKLRHGLESDYALAKTLSVGTGAIANYRKGRSHIDATMAVKIAELLAISPLEVIAAAEIERARNDATRKVWLRYAASFLLGTGLSLAGTPPPAQAGSLHNQNVQADNTHMRTNRRRKASQVMRDTANSALSALARLTMPKMPMMGL